MTFFLYVATKYSVLNSPINPKNMAHAVTVAIVNIIYQYKKITRIYIYDYINYCVHALV